MIEETSKCCGGNGCSAEVVEENEMADEMAELVDDETEIKSLEASEG
jgi:hypothetical protein